MPKYLVDSRVSAVAVTFLKNVKEVITGIKFKTFIRIFSTRFWHFFKKIHSLYCRKFQWFCNVWIIFFNINLSKLTGYFLNGAFFIYLLILSLREKCPNTEIFLVRIFPHSHWIRRDTEYLSRNISVFGHFSRSVSQYKLKRCH